MLWFLISFVVFLFFLVVDINDAVHLFFSPILGSVVGPKEQLTSGKCRDRAVVVYSTTIAALS